MSADKVSLPAVHDWHLRKVLGDIGLLKAVAAGDARCERCHRVISLEQVGGILVLSGRRFGLVCSNGDCLEAAGGQGD